MEVCHTSSIQTSNLSLDMLKECIKNILQNMFSKKEHVSRGKKLKRKGIWFFLLFSFLVDIFPLIIIKFHYFYTFVKVVFTISFTSLKIGKKKWKQSDTFVIISKNIWTKTEDRKQTKRPIIFCGEKWWYNMLDFIDNHSIFRQSSNQLS